jgi:hypothetical protein
MASILKVDKLDPQSGTALEIGTSGDTITVPSGATLDISSATLTPPATLPASSGVNLTALNASNLGSGTVPTARLGSGTASSSTVLYGDQTYKAEPGGGKVLQNVVTSTTTLDTITVSGSTGTSAYADTGLTASITISAASSTVLCSYSLNTGLSKSGSETTHGQAIKLLVDTDSGGYVLAQQQMTYHSYGIEESGTGRFGTVVCFYKTSAQSSGAVLTFKVQHALYSGTTNVSSCYAQLDSMPSNMVLWEIGA